MTDERLIIAATPAHMGISSADGGANWLRPEHVIRGEVEQAVTIIRSTEEGGEPYAVSKKLSFNGDLKLGAYSKRQYYFYKVPVVIMLHSQPSPAPVTRSSGCRAWIPNYDESGNSFGHDRNRFALIGYGEFYSELGIKPCDLLQKGEELQNTKSNIRFDIYDFSQNEIQKISFIGANFNVRFLPAQHESIPRILDAEKYYYSKDSWATLLITEFSFEIFD